MNTIYPFKFLDSYTLEDRDIFFGRDEEIEILYEMVFQTKILLVYGASGTGKTSLIQSGLAGKFETHDWLSLFVRRKENINKSLQEALASAGGNEESDTQALSSNFFLEEYEYTESGGSLSPKKVESPINKSLNNIYLKHFRPIYLIFDQLEELYVIGDKEEQAQFIASVKEILRVDKPVKIIFSIREEYLGRLYEFEQEVPELLRKKLRVEPMNLDKVSQVLLGIHANKRTHVKLQNGEEDQIIQTVFEKIRGEGKGLSIPLPYFQVFLDKLYLEETKSPENPRGDESRQSEAVFHLETLQNMGDIGDVLRDFLDNQVNYIAREQQLDEEDIWKILSPFVTLDGTKQPITQEDLGPRLPEIDTDLIAQVLQSLETRRILRFSEDDGLYEVAHDSLAKQIAEKRSDEEIALMEVQRLIKTQSQLEASVREPFTEKQLNFMEPFLGKLNLSEEDRIFIEESRGRMLRVKQEAYIKAQEEEAKARLDAQKARSQRIQFYLTFIAFGIALLAGVFFYRAQIAQRRASEQASEAQEQRRIALEQQKIAHVEKMKADSARREAEEQKAIAITQKERAAIVAFEAKQAKAKADSIAQALKMEKAKNFIIKAQNMINLREYQVARRYLDEAYALDPTNPKIRELRYASTQ